MFPVTISGSPPPTDRAINVRSLDTAQQGVWHIPEETPVAFVYNRRNYAVMLATPDDMTDYALGFSLSEHIINQASDIENLEIRYVDTGIELHLKIKAERIEAFDIKAMRRNLIGTAGCGICGLENADRYIARLPPVRETPIAIEKTALVTAMKTFNTRQPMNSRTKSMHAAAWVDLKGDIKLVREDVGRHNALDKLIGTKIMMGLSSDGFLLMSSRCSYEIIDKAARAKIPAVLSLSGPTHLALQKAQQARIIVYARDKIGGVKRVDYP